MNLKLSNTQYRFSYYKDLYSVKNPDSEIDINELIEIIQYGYISKEIEELRKTSGEAYKEKKMHLPNVTLSGIFSERNAEHLIKHSGLIQIDIDKIDNYNELFQDLCLDSYTYVCFRSPGGKGIKVVVKINPSAETHREQFNALERYYQTEYDVEIDKNCKDVPRPMLLSYDPNLHCNPFSDVYEELYKPEKEEKKEPVTTPTVSKKRYHKTGGNVVEGIIDSVSASGIDITRDQSDWIKIGYALCTEFGENGRDYFHQLSKNYPKYTQKEADDKYSYLLKHNNGKTTIGTLVYLAKANGVAVKQQFFRRKKG